MKATLQVGDQTVSRTTKVVDRADPTQVVIYEFKAHPQYRVVGSWGYGLEENRHQIAYVYAARDLDDILVRRGLPSMTDIEAAFGLHDEEEDYPYDHLYFGGP